MSSSAVPAPLRTLYPPLEPFAEHRLTTGDGHTLYVEEAGRPDGLPVLFLHGGPGAGCGPLHRRYFDPAVWRIVLFDQRGAGRSTPRGSLRHNTTAHLIADMQRIREHLGLARWLLFGGSWGATLALVYAQAFPEHVSGLVLRGSLLGRARDLDWFTQPSGVRRLFPDAWRVLETAVPEGPGDLLRRAGAAIDGADDARRERVALAWEHYAGQIATLSLPAEEANAPREEDAQARAQRVAAASIEVHYACNGFFLRENQILEDMGRIAHLPAIIVHGRRDLVCTVDGAFALAAAFEAATLDVVRDAGHLGSEPGIVDALVRAAQAMAARLAPAGSQRS